MGNMRYAKRDQDVTTLGTWSVQTGTAVTQYEASHIGTDVIARPAKIAETSGAWVGNFTGVAGGKQRVDAVVLPMHNLTAGLEVRLQGHATSSWGSPTFNQTITIPAYRGDGFPLGAWRDITGLSGYTSAGFEFWRLTVVGVNAAAVALKIKLLSGLQTLSPNINWGEVGSEERKMIEHRTDYGVSSVYDLGVTIRSIQGELDGPDTQRDAVKALWQSTRGRVYPFVLIPDGDVNDAWFVRFADTKLDVQLNMIDRNVIRLGFQEVSRGLVL
jgi:hypothetical protein